MLIVNLLTIFENNVFYLHAMFKLIRTKRCCSHVNEEGGYGQKTTKRRLGLRKGPRI